jgi:hypothetical protein
LALFGNIIAPKSLGDTLQKKSPNAKNIAQRQKYHPNGEISLSLVTLPVA